MGMCRGCSGQVRGQELARALVTRYNRGMSETIRARLFPSRLALVAAIGLLLGGCAASSAPAPPAPVAPDRGPAAPPSASAAAARPDRSPAEPPPISGTERVGLLNTLTDGPLYIAIERGYLRQQGLEVEAVPFTEGGQMVPALAAGDLDVGSGAPAVGFFNAIARGLSLKIVADKYQATANQASNAFVVRKDLVDTGQFKSYADLRGRTVATTSKPTSAGYAIHRALQSEGLSYDDVSFVELGFPNINAAL